MYCARSSNPRRTPAPAWTEHSPARDIVEFRVTEQLLHRPDVGAALQEMSREGVPECVHGRMLQDVGAADCETELALQMRR